LTAYKIKSVFPVCSQQKPTETGNGPEIFQKTFSDRFSLASSDRENYEVLTNEKRGALLSVSCELVLDLALAPP
jgi:hypothetical protein